MGVEGGSEERWASMGAAEAKHTSAGGGDMDASETIYGQRERAPVEGVTDSDIPTQSSGQKCRVGDPPWACGAERGVARKHTEWWHCEAKEDIAVQSRKDPSAPRY